MRSIWIFIVIGFLFVSCGHVDPNKHVDEGHVNENVYKSVEIGWTISIPNGWEVITRDKLEENDQRGLEALEKVVGGEIGTSGLKHLISFKKDQFNFFASTSQPVKEEYPGEYMENSKNLNQLVFDTYKDNGIRVDTLSGFTTISGLRFQKFEIKVYGRDGKMILNQLLYSRLLNGFDFGINVNYNNEKDRDVMLNVLKESKFEKK